MASKLAKEIPNAYYPNQYENPENPKAPYQTNPPRYTYSLTPKGADLKSVLLAMIAWSGKHVPGARKPPAKFMKGM